MMGEPGGAVLSSHRAGIVEILQLNVAAWLSASKAVSEEALPVPNAYDQMRA